MAKFHAFWFHKFSYPVFTVRYHRTNEVGSEADCVWYVPETYNGED